MKKIIIIIISAFMMCVKCYSQFGQLFTTENNLSSSLVNCILQDNKGLIWIATQDGLNCYDSNKLTTYSKNGKNGLDNNLINYLYQTKEHNLYIGTYDGIERFDYATNTLKRIRTANEKSNDNKCFVQNIMQRQNGDVLISTSGHGVFRMKRNDDKATALKGFPGGKYIRAIHETKDGILWVVSENNGAFRISHNHVEQFFANTSLQNSVFNICEDRMGNIYLGTMNDGVFVCNKGQNKFYQIAQTKNNPISAIYTSRSGQIFIGTDGRGMILYDPHNGSVANCPYYCNEIDLNKTKIHSIIEDRNGDIWLGLFQKGIFFQPSQDSQFKYIGYKFAQKNTIGSACVMAVMKDSYGTIWTGTDNDGLYGIDVNGMQKIHYEHNSHSTSVPPTVLCICEDSHQQLWIGSYLNGCGTIDRKTGKYTQLPFTEGNAKHVFSMVTDDKDNLWIATLGDGIKCYNTKSKKKIGYRATKQNMSFTDNSLYNNFVSCLKLSNDGKRLFIATSNGLSCLDLKRNSFVSTFGRNQILNGNAIYCIFEDAKNNLWVGSTNGLFYVDIKRHQTKCYTTTDGLQNNTIRSIESDAKGNLWISTNKGLSYMEVDKKKFINYSSSNGLRGNEFSNNASFNEKNKYMVFGGTNGLTFVNPQMKQNRGKKPRIYLTNFYINEQEVTKGAKSGVYQIVDTAIIDARLFNLSHDDNSFTLELSAMEYNNSEQITYMYSINEDGWINVGHGMNKINFSHLPPGTYKFHICSKLNEVTSDIKEFTIIIHPAWYVSVWAYIIYSLIAIYVIFFLILSRRKKEQAKLLLQEHIHAEELNEAKLQFFVNISHEIRTPMTLIISPLQKLINIDDNEARHKTYVLIKRNAERILSLINQMMDIRKIDKGRMVLYFKKTDMIPFVNEVYSMFEYQAKEKNIDFRFTHDTDSLEAWIDKMNFDKVIVNVLSNAFKFTPVNGKITIKLTHDETHFEIKVSDNGDKINEDKLEKIFERFYQINNTSNDTYVGTGVGLHLTRSLVELHHGTIVAKNDDDGCSFIISLPLGNAHLKPEELRDDHAWDAEQDLIENYTKEDVVPDDAPIETLYTKASITKNTVMIVEDDDEIRKYVAEELEPSFNIVECTNGKEALTIILKDSPDLVISDIMMPQMDGITLCHHIKKNININHIPVVILTAKNKDEDKKEGLDIGADAYIVKPFSIDILRKTVENLIHNRAVLKNKFSGKESQEDKVEKVTILSPDEKLLERVMKVINKNISNSDLNVEFVANEVGISRAHLHRKLKELTNQSPSDLIRNIRLKQAANMMINSHQNITEVMYAVGFNSLASFSTIFKNFYGVSPKEYMHRQREKD